MGLRQARLADEMRDVLAATFTGGQLSDPRVAGVTITAVKLSADLQLATVYFRIYGEGPERTAPDAAAGLKSATGFLRRVLADAFDIRRVPNLRFFYDESIERGSKIESLLAQI
ncbi:MAG: 30S ribosome-binding factor RbfA [Deltaproteobacteria bacterium]|nr:30S ribosome-binding factor RbfA [Deltaproteobacteria bacterium]